METLALTFSTGWASGINAYLVVLVLGIADRVGDLDRIPDVLGSWPVLAAAGGMYALEFVTDKIPYVDSTWDAISTVIRPTVGAVIGVLLAGEADSLNEAVGGVTGGLTAFLAHLAKSGGRLAINASPEPFSNIGASLTEDLSVLGVGLLALQHPQIAASIAAVLLILGLLLAYVLGSMVRRGWRRWKRRPV
ncbi:DUF4126 domain-containing protein [Nocardioides sp. Kera G14]|uniref:DUF4126 domain-containing protein n=1 Tax=Nocardioides sp. Kera G14 TaxID=2884264 RepID=UPI001D127BA3|nr:DUF4126 domain-containing protein [Nocardioides sp. Kera G14]UDY22501.1 DUF4126 domain-containing protein [Nocardioides sp. Kera G14]